MDLKSIGNAQEDITGDERRSTLEMSPVDKVVYGKKQTSNRLQYPCLSQG